MHPQIIKNLITDNTYLLNSSELGDKQQIGSGSYGLVYKATYCEVIVALKEINIESSDIDQNLLISFETECRVLARLRYSHIVDFKGYFLAPKPTIVMEYMCNGPLHKLLLGTTVIPWKQRLKIAADITKGLMFLHKNSILHLDLKSSNVLLDDRMTAKLCDFGLAQFKEETRSFLSSRTTINKESNKQNDIQSQKYEDYGKGTPQWMAPELHSTDPVYSEKSDIYSLGIIFWEIYSRKIPFKMVNKYTLPMAIKNGEREKIQPDCPAPFEALIRDCWAQQPINRPTAEEVLKRIKGMEGTQEFAEEEIEKSICFDYFGIVEISNFQIY